MIAEIRGEAATYSPDKQVELVNGMANILLTTGGFSNDEILEMGTLAFRPFKGINPESAWSLANLAIARALILRQDFPNSGIPHESRIICRELGIDPAQKRSLPLSEVYSAIEEGRLFMPIPVRGPI